MPPTSRIEVDLTAISANVRVVRSLLEARIAGAIPGPSGMPAAGQVQQPGICAVLKADAYSLGAARIAKRLAIAGVEMLAVYTPDQARALVEASINAPILMLMPIHEMDRGDVLYRTASRGQLHFTIHDASTLDALENIVDTLGLHLTAHLEIDTGMSRGGSSPEGATRLLERIIAHKRINLAGIFNHFASADGDDAFTRAQAETFSHWLEANRDMIPKDCLIHEANTYGMFRSSTYHRSMVRIGLALLGYGAEEFGDPQAFEFTDEARRLTPCVRWLSQIVQVKKVAAGTPVGYKSTWRAARPTRLGLVPVGYADGYPLALSNKAHVGLTLTGGIKAYVPVIGRVSMDQITVDLTDIPENQAVIGTMVEIIGRDGTAPNHLATLAQKAGTISHEILCRFTARLPRQYIAVEQPTSSVVSGSVAV